MKNIGAKLQTAREEKGLSVDDVARETNIARRYIIALEVEDFSQFPAEAYVLGFLKNYGEYLGLNTEELHAQYKVLKIQEQPVPVNELLNKPSPLPRILVMGAIVVCAGALVGGAVYFIRSMVTGARAVEESREPVVYNLSSGLMEKRFFLGDSVTISEGGNNFSIELSKFGEVVTLKTSLGDLMIGLGQDAVMDINGDGLAELRVQVADYAADKSDMGVLLRFELSSESNFSGTAAETPAASSEEEKPVEQAAEVAVAVSAPNSSSVDVFNSANPYPFTLEVSFQGYCMFRWEILREAGRQARNERYFVRGEDINVQAQNGIRVWMSNAGAAKMQVIGGGRTVKLDAGASGVVAVADLFWQRGSDGRYKLVFVRLEN